jgi:nicotinate-nucleotide adenylyltransferase
MANIGLFGGTFDPIHLGHLKTVVEVKDRFQLETVYLIPAAQPPHKTDRAIAPPANRMAMLNIAVANLDGLAVSDAEINRSGLSYSVETVDEFRQRFNGTANLFFILGLDAFFEIHTWKAYRHLFELVAFIVMSRPGSGSGQSPPARETLQAFLDARISNGYVFESETDGFRHPDLQPVRLFAATPVDISSTGIRKKIMRQQPFEHLLPEGVAAYIRRKGLYQ